MDKDYLVLKRASARRPSGEWNDDDFDVLCDGAIVGRIFKVNAAPVGTPWMWTLAVGHPPVGTAKKNREATAVIVGRRGTNITDDPHRHLLRARRERPRRRPPPRSVMNSRRLIRSPRRLARAACACAAHRALLGHTV
jgi:hypothetical protein